MTLYVSLQGSTEVYLSDILVSNLTIMRLPIKNVVFKNLRKPERSSQNYILYFDATLSGAIVL